MDVPAFFIWNFFIFLWPIRIPIMGLHKNSQKRIYCDEAYFITTKTYCNYPFFHEDIFL